MFSLRNTEIVHVVVRIAHSFSQNLEIGNAMTLTIFIFNYQYHNHEVFLLKLSQMHIWFCDSLKQTFTYNLMVRIVEPDFCVRIG